MGNRRLCEPPTITLQNNREQPPFAVGFADRDTVFVQRIAAEILQEE